MVHYSSPHTSIQSRYPPASEEEIPELDPASDESESFSSEWVENEAFDSLGPNNASRTTRTRSVSFSFIEIREYKVILGDNPSVSMGCPLSLGWEYESEFTGALDDYEAAKPKARAMSELRMPSSEREEKLRSVGFSRSEIREGTKTAHAIRRQRIKTVESLRLSKFQELVEKAKRKVFGAGQKGNEMQKMAKSVSLDSFLATHPNATLKQFECGGRRHAETSTNSRFSLDVPSAP